MKNSIYKSLIAIFVVVGFLTFFGSTHEAKAWKVVIEITLGHKEKGICTGDGICSIKIKWELGGMSGTIGRKQAPGEIITIEGDAEIQGDYLIIKLKDKLGKEFMNPDGRYVLPVPKEIKVTGSNARSMGYKKFTMANGNYEFDGSTVKIKLVEKTVLDNKSKQD